eukprot:m.108105 g.108105  ORF g.108105 m.108105 type:complete len:93 (-) comp27847_c1_seq1:87-365(-)
MYAAVNDVSFISNSNADNHGSFLLAMKDRTRAISLRVCHPAGWSKLLAVTKPNPTKESTSKQYVFASILPCIGRVSNCNCYVVESEDWMRKY